MKQSNFDRKSLTNTHTKTLIGVTRKSKLAQSLRAAESKRENLE